MKGTAAESSLFLAGDKVGFGICEPVVGISAEHKVVRSDCIT